MAAITDNLNCIKNLMQMMCCDGTIHAAEKSFLSRAAVELDVQVDDWNSLLKEVLKDSVPLYPVQNRDKAVATLKSLIVMSKADGQVDSKEKTLAVQFAKSIGINKSEWKRILKDINLEGLFEPFSRTAGSVTVIRDDFDKLDAFLQFNERNVLDHAGTITADLGKQHALAEFEKFDQERRRLDDQEPSDFDQAVDRVKRLEHDQDAR